MENFFDSMRVQLFLQAAFGISPFIRRGNRVVSSRWINAHSIVILIIFVFVVWTSIIEILKEVSGWTESGSYLWMIIIFFELIFTNTAFPLLIVHSLLWKKQQMDFFNRVFALDESMQQHFRINIQPTHRALFIRTIGMFLICFLYYGIITFFAIVGPLTSSTENKFVTYSLAYQLEQIATGFLSSAVINAALILKSRFQLLQMVQLILLSSDGDIASRKLRLSVWLFNFKELCSLVDLFSQKFGAILIVRFAHDFTLLTSQCYLIFWIIFSVASSNANKWGYVSLVCFWMLQNIVKIGATAIVAQMTINEVCGVY